MKKTPAFVGGKKISVSNKQLNVKFNKTINELNDGLSRAQKELGLTYSSNERLIDSQGRCVEGLSLWQIKLGMWIDETAKARTIAGGYAEGLSRTELELGYYADKRRARSGKPNLRETRACTGNTMRAGGFLTEGSSVLQAGSFVQPKTATSLNSKRKSTPRMKKFAKFTKTYSKH